MSSTMLKRRYESNARRKDGALLIVPPIETRRRISDVAHRAVFTDSEGKCLYDDPRLDLYCCYTAEDFADDELGTVKKRRSGGPGLLRYPGGKTKLVKKIVTRLESIFQDLSPSAEYREPFLGSGAVAMSFLKQQPGR